MRWVRVVGMAGVSVLWLAACAATPPPVSGADKPPPDPQAVLIAQWLYEAEDAFDRYRLMTPAHDNAWDRYQDILAIDPDNQAARTGLKKIGRRYLSMAKDAAQRGNLAAARRYTARARQADPDYAGVARMERYLARRSQEQSNVYWLDAEALGARSAAAVAALQRIAREAKVLNSRVLVVARSDAEGRWMYQAMRAALNGYRLRANLETGPWPRVVLLDKKEE